jgi:hypothetical protein
LKYTAAGRRVPALAKAPEAGGVGDVAVLKDQGVLLLSERLLADTQLP